MKQGYVVKSAEKSAQVDEVDLGKINQFTRRDFTSDELYTFNVVLCDNDIDRDNECFSVKALEQMAYLFVGKTGIFNHDPKGENQTARIYDTKVCYDNERKTQTGDNYVYLLGKAYMVRGEKTSDLILDIEAGIKKEVSVSCTAKTKTCSICGKEFINSSCEHRQGKIYNKKLCYGVLSDITDAYEWSFVAVPAQKRAGVIKHFNANEKEGVSMGSAMDIIKSLKTSDEMRLSKSDMMMISDYIENLNQKASLGESYLKSVQENVVRLGFIVDPSINAEIFSSVVKKMSLDELLAFEKSYKLKLEKKSGAGCQLNNKEIKSQVEKANTDFKI